MKKKLGSGMQEVVGRVRKGYSEGSYLSWSVAGTPKLKAAFLSPNTSYLFTLFFFVSLQPHLTVNALFSS